ncbi:MAG: GSCFA domain-containing protein [Bacteroidaceae bacterium]|nr:GSCFA domain-containing protein [Bacteroidaceae bacterium]
MKLQTPIEIPQPLRLIGLRNRVAFIGSCFAENIGSRMRQSGLPALVNPFGVLYNPVSILQVLTQNPMQRELYFEDEDLRWHCWLTDSSKNASTLEACQAAVLSARGRLFEFNPDTVVITLGTNRYYEREEGQVVGNCHKRPQAEFTEQDMSVEEAAAALEAICQLFPQAQVVFTVSPYRYAKYGFHESRLSKAVLLLAVDAVIRRHPEQACYFPAYELQLDELRDYRFYAEDMLHPSPQAVDYIWERFADRWFDAETHRYLVDYEPIRRALHHRPTDPDSPATIRFREQTQQQLTALMAKYNLEL